MKILVACDLPEDALRPLNSLATEVLIHPDADGPRLRELIKDVGILVVGDARVAPETIAHGKSLQMIVRAGPGPGEVAVDEASGQGVFVTHCPDQHATAVAELAFALMLALDRRIIENMEGLRDGRWNREEVGDADGLAGRTLGILGYNAVGKLVAERARAFGMHIVAWSPSTAGGPAPTDPSIEFCNWPRELARKADVVTVHVGSDEARGAVVDAEFLASMKPGASLVHVGHPGAADEGALLEAVQQQKIRVALDVFTSAPAGDHARFRCSLCSLPGVVVTQHIGPLTAQARRAVAAEVVRIIREFVVTGEAIQCINLLERSPATWQLVLRVRDQVGVMAAILEAIRADGINAQEITSRVFTGAKAASCTIALDERPSTEALEAVGQLADVMHLELRAMV